MWKTISVILLSLACALNAQDAAQSSVDLGARPDATPSPLDHPAKPDATPPPMDLGPTPNEATEARTPPPDVPELGQLDEAFKQTSLGKSADEFRTRVEWRKLQNDVSHDPAVVAAKKNADSARTDLEKRERLRDYYELFYGKMRARASTPEMKTALATFKTDHLRLLAQPRVRPNSDLPMETPTPSPGKKQKK